MECTPVRSKGCVHVVLVFVDLLGRERRLIVAAVGVGMEPDAKTGCPFEGYLAGVAAGLAHDVGDISSVTGPLLVNPSEP